MGATRGFFSLVQFCPDLDRGEGANVGVVLVVPGAAFAEVRFAADNEGPKQRFGADSFDDARLSAAKRALEGRIREHAASLGSAEALERFGRLEGNHLLLTPPKTMLVEHPAAELDELYERLVHVDPKRRRRQSMPDLDALFASKLGGVPLQRDVVVDLAELGTLRVPYAYQNGVLNLVRPEGFPRDDDGASRKANDLAVKGHIIATRSKAAGHLQQLVVVGAFDPALPGATRRRVEFVLRNHDARLVDVDDIDDFVAEVRREAHA